MELPELSNFQIIISIVYLTIICMTCVLGLLILVTKHNDKLNRPKLLLVACIVLLLVSIMFPFIITGDISPRNIAHSLHFLFLGIVLGFVLYLFYKARDTEETKEPDNENPQQD